MVTGVSEWESRPCPPRSNSGTSDSADGQRCPSFLSQRLHAGVAGNPFTVGHIPADFRSINCKTASTVNEQGQTYAAGVIFQRTYLRRRTVDEVYSQMTREAFQRDPAAAKTAMIAFLDSFRYVE